jgi:hypothetical protein
MRMPYLRSKLTLAAVGVAGALVTAAAVAVAGGAGVGVAAVLEHAPATRAMATSPPNSLLRVGLACHRE